LRQLTENEIRHFYEAYRAMEESARFHHRAAVHHAIQRDFFALVVAVFLGVVVFLGIVLYQALL
jgi:hypothetical protein